MMKIIVGTFGQETNTFSPDRIGCDKLMPTGWIKAETMLEEYRGTGTYIGGAIAAAEEAGIEIVPVDSMKLSGGPLITDECLEHALDHICTQISKNIDEVDGIFLGMHGGGRTELVEDLEAYTLRRIRDVAGDLPIMSSLDLHCNMTPERVALSDGLFVIKESPHIDKDKAGYLATKTLIRKIRGEVNPIMTMVHLPLLFPHTTTSTYMNPMKEIKEYFEQYSKDHNFIDVSVCQGFAANDQPWAGASVLIVAERKATEEANELAEYLWSRRFEFDPNPITPKQAIDIALLSFKDGYVIINEPTDNPGSGCPGDGTHLLSELIHRNIPQTVFMSIFDPEVAEQSHKAGVGSFIDIRLGGKTAIICGDPLELKHVEVLNLSNGNFHFVTPQDYGLKSSFGRSVRLRHRNVEIVVVSIRNQAFDDRGLLITGADINDYKIVCLKSANHFRGYFQDRADAIITCDTPGLRSTNLKTYPYKYVRRPIYPLDENVTFHGK